MADLAETQAAQLVPLLRQLTDQLQRSETERAALTEKIAQLEQLQQAQGDNLIRRIQTAIAQTDRHADRLSQRIEQVSADESRLATQLQYIENVVEETRAMQSRALAVIPHAPVLPLVRRRRGNLAAALILIAGLAAAGGLVWVKHPPAALWSRFFAVQPIPSAAPADPAAQFLLREAEAAPSLGALGPDPSLPAATRPLETKALSGDAAAEHDLAALYTGGHAGIAADDRKAALWFREAAIRGSANARYNLGVLYQQGMGVEKNLVEAIAWYQAAAALGHPQAHYNLGIARVEGVGLPYDPSAAAQDFRAAARAGLPEANYNLGLIFETGLLGHPDLSQALYWYGRAAALGSKQAESSLVRTAEAASLSPDDVAQRIRGLNPDMPLLQEEAPAAASVLPGKPAGAAKPPSPAPSPLPPTAPSDTDAGDLAPADRTAAP